MSRFQLSGVGENVNNYNLYEVIVGLFGLKLDTNYNEIAILSGFGYKLIQE